MAQYHLGHNRAARDRLDQFESWYSQQRVPKWRDRLRWQLLHQEARTLINTMPRAADPPQGQGWLISLTRKSVNK
jgi:hypothetical protein